MVRIHNGPPSISSNSQLAYRDLIPRGRQPETARREQDKVDRSILEVHPFLPAWSGSQASAFSIASVGKVLE